MSPEPQRKIIHIDADCFYAAIEMRDDPELRDRPLAVGGSADGRGVLTTCNYQARAYGVRSAMPSAIALRLCPDLVIVKTRFDAYREASARMREIFFDYTELVEPLSLDEAFLDVSAATRCQGSATFIAREIRQRVAEEIGITVSAGVAPNKFIAKISSDWDKPDGLFVVTPDEVDDFVARLPVGKLFGVGKVTEKKLARLGIRSCAELRALSVFELVDHFGSFGKHLHELANGRDEREVKPSRRRKSLSVERTFPHDLANASQCEAELPGLLQEMQRRLAGVDKDYLVTRLFVKVKFDDFSQTTVERPVEVPSLSDVQALCREGYARMGRPVRLLGLGVRFAELPAEPTLDQMGMFEGDAS